VSLGYWQDRPPEEALLTAKAADRLGYRELWLGEMATYDAFALATAVGLATERIGLVIGPLAVSVRDPMQIARGVASVAALTGRATAVALGTSSPLVVGNWHGRDPHGSQVMLRESAEVLRTLLAGEKATYGGEMVRTRGYHLRLTAPSASITVAAFGPTAVRTAAACADRMVLNLVTPEAAAQLADSLRANARECGRAMPPLAAWVPCAVGAEESALEQMRRGLVSYLAAPGYGEMFDAAGFGEVVEYARTRPHPRELLAAVPLALVEAIGLVGEPAAIRTRLAHYAAAGVDEVALVPASTAADPGGERTLAAVLGAAA